MITLEREAWRTPIRPAGWLEGRQLSAETSQKERLYLHPGDLTLLCQGFSAIPEDRNVTFLSFLPYLHTRCVNDEFLDLASYSYLTDFIVCFSHNLKYCSFEFNRTCLQIYFIPEEFLYYNVGLLS